MIKYKYPNRLLLFLLLCCSGVHPQETQKDAPDQQVPVSTRWLLDSAGPIQRASINSVYLLVCSKTKKKGTAFLLTTGIMVTDNHVVEGCLAQDLSAKSSSGEQITFSKMVADTARDLALLKPSKRIDGGLALGDDKLLKAGESVTTWGFPLIYNGPAPLLSVGYLSGFEAAQQGGRTVKHLVVNGAFNPGNSGGPLLLSGHNEVVGIVVWKMLILAPWTQALITGLKSSNVVISSGVTMTTSDGKSRSLGQHEITAMVLEEFYNTVQVMIGEATSVSELKEFIKAHGSELN